MSGDGLTGRDLAKVFPDGTRALDGVSFSVRRGRVLTLLGPSGCGKSTLLRIVAGLEAPTSGSLELDGRPLDPVPPGKREVGFVFQNYALYPHLTVGRNLGLALEVRGVPEEERERRVRATAERLGIDALLERRPGQLSGGQQQRVALGRALVRRPRLYLLDEPLSNLDALLREGMRAELQRLFRDVGATVLYVTHDQAEAMSLSDEIAVMRAGRVHQCASPLELYARPADRFVAGFVGSPRMSFVRGRREGARFEGEGMALPVPEGLPGGRELWAGIRPEDLVVAREPAEGAIPAAVQVAEAQGASVLLTLRAGAAELRASVPAGSWPDKVHVRWPPERTHWFDVGDERRLEPAARGGASADHDA